MFKTLLIVCGTLFIISLLITYCIRRLVINKFDILKQAKRRK
jgi:hypothetical protein